MTAAQVVDLTPQDSPSFRDMIRDVLATGEVDPRRVAAKVLPTLTDADRDELVQQALVNIACEIIRRGRSIQPDPAPAPGGEGGRWGQIAKASHDPMTWPVSVNGREDGWKPLGECTVTEVRMLADLYLVRARQNKARADRFRVLADAMTKAGADKVALLDADVVRRVMTA